MGIVFRAFDPMIHRHVAIKAVRLPEDVSSAQREHYRKRILREIRSVGRLDHRGIVTIYHSGEDQGLPYIAMEFVEGKTLEDYRVWKHAHSRSDPFPGGESLDDAARRYAGAFERLLERPETSILVVTHEIPLRYAINATDGSDELDGPTHQLANATPYLFDAEALRLAVIQIRRLVG